MTGSMKASREAQLAIPLCLPSNYKWNKHTGECIKIGEERSSLYVIDEALNQLYSIKGKRAHFSCQRFPGTFLSFEHGTNFPMHDLINEFFLFL